MSWWHRGEELTSQRWEAAQEAYRLYLLGNGKSPETAATYIRHLTQFQGWCQADGVPVLRIKPISLHRHIVSMFDTGYAAGTVNTRIAALKSFYRWAVAEGLQKGDPSRDLRMHKEKIEPRQPLSKREAQALVGAADTKFERAILLLLMGSGIRRGELLCLQIEDINWRASTILVRGKGLKQRLVAPGRAPMLAVREYLASRERGYIFLWPGTGRPVSRSSLGRMLHAVERRARTSNVYPHRFRTTAICWLLDKGADLIAVSVIAGHANLETTRRYQQAVEQRRALAQQARLSLADRL